MTKKNVETIQVRPTYTALLLETLTRTKNKKRSPRNTPACLQRGQKRPENIASNLIMICSQQQF